MANEGVINAIEHGNLNDKAHDLLDGITTSIIHIKNEIFKLH
jgi:hypothetical protein